MGYESKIYVCDKHDWGKHNNDSSCESYSYYETICAFEMCKMGYANGWRELFSTPIGENDHWFGMDGNDYIHEDLYGDVPCYAPLEDVLAWVEKEMRKDDYRRLPILYRALKAFEDNIGMWGNIVIMHYGH